MPFIFLFFPFSFFFFGSIHIKLILFNTTVYPTVSSLLKHLFPLILHFANYIHEMGCYKLQFFTIVEILEGIRGNHRHSLEHGEKHLDSTYESLNMLIETYKKNAFKQFEFFCSNRIAPTIVKYMHN